MSDSAAPAAAPSAVHAGTWKLARDRAMSLRPRRASVLTLAEGRVWATVDGPHGGPLPGMGDHILEAGDQLVVAPGRQLVIETWGAPASFHWDPLPQAAGRPVRMRADIAQPLADLRHALALALHAAGRLGAALVGLRPARGADNCPHGASQVFPA
jgi:hypothetical protein